MIFRQMSGKSLMLLPLPHFHFACISTNAHFLWDLLCHQALCVHHNETKTATIFFALNFLCLANAMNTSCMCFTMCSDTKPIFRSTARKIDDQQTAIRFAWTHAQKETNCQEMSILLRKPAFRFIRINRFPFERNNVKIGVRFFVSVEIVNVLSAFMLIAMLYKVAVFLIVSA